MGEAWRDLSNPIIPAIATVRASNPGIPIYVLDASDRVISWGKYALKLDFNVIKTKPCLKTEFPNSTLQPYMIKLLSRVFDVRNFAFTLPTQNVLFADSDVLWLKDPMPQPEAPRGIHGIRTNNGVLIYSTGCGIAEQAFKYLKEQTVKCVIDEKFRSTVTSHYYSKSFNDEAVYVYSRIYRPDLFRDLPLWDNFCDFSKKDMVAVLAESKNYHFCRHHCGDERGLIALIIKEYYMRLRFVMNKAEIAKIYGEDNMMRAREYDFVQLHRAMKQFKSKVKIFL